MRETKEAYNPRTKDRTVTVTAGASLLGIAKYYAALKSVVVNQYSQIFPFGKVMKLFADDDYEDIVRIEHTRMKRKDIGL